VTLLKLYFVFFNIGLFTIGGGLASLPLLQQAVVEPGLISQGEFVDMLAISQSTPGPIGINMATFAGYKMGAVPGGIIATLGMVTPSLLIILLIAACMKNFASRPAVRNAMSTLRPVSLGLITSAAWFICGQALLISEPSAETGIVQGFLQSIHLPALLLFIATATACRLKPASPLVYIAAGGVLGILIF